MTQNTQWNKPLAMQYFAAYAKFVKKNLEEGIKLNSAEKLRGKIGSAEFEYNDSTKISPVVSRVSEALYAHPGYPVS